MRSHPFRCTSIAAAVGGALLALAGGQAYGSAFALQEQSGSGLGNAFAGGAAAAEDASTVYWNPAGMSRMPGIQFAGAASLICPSNKFQNEQSQPAALQPLGGNGGDAGNCAGVPAVYLVVPYQKQWAFGIGVNVPFGLKTKYDSDWIGRFQAIESKLDTINVNPSLSWKPTDNFTVGAGVNWQRIKATLTKDVNYAGTIATAAQLAAAGGVIPPASVAPIVGAYAGSTSFVKVHGDDNAWGWDIGVLWEIDSSTRIGATYRSSIKYTITGPVEFTNPGIPSSLPAPLVPVATALSTCINTGAGCPIPLPPPLPFNNGDVSVSIKVPSTTNVSFFKAIDRWDWMADLQFTNWSSIQNLTIVRSNGVVLQSEPENFKNTWRGSIGANYHYSDQWMFRGGIAYDETPVNNTDRTPRLPDNNRTWFSIGAQYKFNAQTWLDFGYTYIYLSNPSINQNQGSTATYGLINGHYKDSVNLAAVQLTYTWK
jgi:long-chain fatty acid transport protein